MALSWHGLWVGGGLQLMTRTLAYPILTWLQVLWPWWGIFREICAHDRQWGQLPDLRSDAGSKRGAAARAARPQQTLLGLRLHEHGPDYRSWRVVLAEMLQIPLSELPLPPLDGGMLPTSKVHMLRPSTCISVTPSPS